MSEGFEKRNVELIEIVKREDMNKVYSNLKLRLKEKEKIVLFINSNISVLEKFIERDENVKSIKVKSSLREFSSKELKDLYDLFQNPPEDLDFLIIHVSMLAKTQLNFDLKKFSTFVISSNTNKGTLRIIDSIIPENCNLLEINSKKYLFKAEYSKAKNPKEIIIPDDFLNKKLTKRDKERLSEHFWLLDARRRVSSF